MLQLVPTAKQVENGRGLRLLKHEATATKHSNHGSTWDLGLVC